MPVESRAEIQVSKQYSCGATTDQIEKKVEDVNAASDVFEQVSLRLNSRFPNS